MKPHTGALVGTMPLSCQSERGKKTYYQIELNKSEIFIFDRTWSRFAKLGQIWWHYHNSPMLYQQGGAFDIPMDHEIGFFARNSILCWLSSNQRAFRSRLRGKSYSDPDSKGDLQDWTDLLQAKERLSTLPCIQDDCRKTVVLWGTNVRFPVFVCVVKQQKYTKSIRERRDPAFIVGCLSSGSAWSSFILPPPWGNLSRRNNVASASYGKSNLSNERADWD